MSGSKITRGWESLLAHSTARWRAKLYLVLLKAITQYTTYEEELMSGVISFKVVTRETGTLVIITIINSSGMYLVDYTSFWF